MNAPRLARLHAVRRYRIRRALELLEQRRAVRDAAASALGEAEARLAALRAERARLSSMPVASVDVSTLQWREQRRVAIDERIVEALEHVCAQTQALEDADAAHQAARAAWRAALTRAEALEDCARTLHRHAAQKVARVAQRALEERFAGAHR